MLRLLPSRRDVLRVGTVAVLAPATLRPALATSRRPQARAVILLFLDGGPSHIDLFDLKPEAPAEVRGPFAAINTTVPGVRVCEHRSEEHTSELQSLTNLVCRLLLDKIKYNYS